jgi:hypothetical protein
MVFQVDCTGWQITGNHSGRSLDFNLFLRVIAGLRKEKSVEKTSWYVLKKYGKSAQKSGRVKDDRTSGTMIE